MFIAFSTIGPRCGCGAPGLTEDNKLNTNARIGVALILGDALICITTLAVVIASKVGTLQGIPPAALYVAIGSGGAISVSWLGRAAWTKGKSLSYAFSHLYCAVVSQKPSQTSNQTNYDGDEDESYYEEEGV